jgi:hypothetical protein
MRPKLSPTPPRLSPPPPRLSPPPSRLSPLRRPLGWLVLAPLLLGCSPLRLVTPDEPPVDAFGEAPYGWGKVCVLRPHSLGFALTAPVRDNGQLVGATRGPSYFCYLVPPGPHRISAQTDEEPAVELSVREGERYYLHHEIRLGSDRLAVADEGWAREAIDRCEYRLLAQE